MEASGNCNSTSLLSSIPASLPSSCSAVLTEVGPVSIDGEAMLAAILLPYGGLLIKVDEERDVALISFPSKVEAEGFSPVGYTTKILPPLEVDMTSFLSSTSTDASSPCSPPCSSFSYKEKTMTCNNSQSSISEKSVPEENDNRYSNVPIQAGPCSPSFEIKSRRKSATSATNRQPLSEADTFYLMCDVDLMAPLICGFLLFYTSLCILF